MSLTCRRRLLVGWLVDWLVAEGGNPGPKVVYDGLGGGGRGSQGGERGVVGEGGEEEEEGRGRVGAKLAVVVGSA